MPLTARTAALKALMRYRRSSARTEDALNAVLSGGNIDAREASLCTRIFYGVVQNTALIDYYINVYSSVKTQKLEPQVLDILRLSVYQLTFMSKIPVSAAVSEGVALTKKHANPRAAGLVNAVLRKLSQNLNSLPEPGGNTLEKLSVKYSHPLWLVRAFSERLGTEEETEALLKANNADAPVTVMVNTVNATAAETLVKLRSDDGVEAAMHPWLDNCIVLQSARNITRLSTFKEGLIYVQDAAAALTVEAAGVMPGMFVIDGCAAPGGKSFGAAIRMKNTGRILSCDLQEKKLGLITEGAGRLGLSMITTRSMDAQIQDESLIQQADVVIADVPCSGFGVIRKKPEIRYKREEEVAGLPELQLRIAETLSSYVKPGGVLLYSTCTLLKSENEDVIEMFLKNHAEFTPEAFALPEPIKTMPDGGSVPESLTLWPHIHGTDGFFICRLRRRQ